MIRESKDLEVLYNIKTGRYTLLDKATGDTAQIAYTAACTITGFIEIPKNSFTNREAVETYVKTFKPTKIATTRKSKSVLRTLGGIK